MRLLEALKSRLGSLSDQSRLAPAFRWGLVTGVSPVSVRLDADQSPTVGVSKICRVREGDRVLVLLWNRRAVVLGVAAGGDLGDRVVINGVEYPASGSWPVSVSSWALASDPFAATLQLIAPFVPPPGWGFETFTAVSSSYTFVQTGSYSEATNRLQVRVLQRGSNSLTALSRVGWRLTKQ